MRWSIILFFLVFSAASAQQAGDLDSSFAVDGKLVMMEYGSVKEVIPLPTGKILALAVPLSGPGAFVVRLESNGTVDQSFGQDGYIEIADTVKRCFSRSDGRILIVKHNTISCYDENGDPDPTYGTNGMVALDLIDGPMNFLEADLDAYDRLAVCGSGTRMFIVDPLGYIIPESVHAMVNYTTPCPLGFNFYAYLPQAIRFTPNGEVWFYFRRMYYHTCGPNPTYQIMLRNRYNVNGEFIATGSVSPSSNSGNIPHFTRVMIADNGNYLHAITNTQQGVPHLEAIILDATICLGGETSPLYFPGYVNYSNKQYGRIAIDQQGHYLAPLNVGNTFWSYRTIPYCDAPDVNWGYEGFHPPDTIYPVAGGAEAAAIQQDGKALVGGFLTIDGEDRFTLIRYHNIPDPRAYLDLRMMLGGAFDPQSGQMQDQLRSSGSLPALSPYTAPVYPHLTTTTVQMTQPEVFANEGDSAVVDWVWLELLEPTDTANVIAARAALLLSNGAVTANDGRSPVDMNCGAGSYFLRVRHRNHLSVTLADPITLGLEPLAVDLRSPSTATFGTDALWNINGQMVLWPGDATSDGQLKYIGAGNDRDAVLIAVGGAVPTATITGYHAEDVNMDGVVKYMGAANDRDLILQMIGGVPNGVRVEQGP